VVALAAPAGWGKTTALAQWAAASRLPIAWYTLDASDRDPQLFLDYLLHAVAPFAPEAGDVAARLAAAAPQELPSLMRAAALALAAAPRPFALVLDDFHLLMDEPLGLPGTALALDLLASLVEYAPNCHLVLASRTVPALRGMVRLIAQQRAAVFDYGALQFNAAEVQQLAGITGQLLLSDDSASRLTVNLGGWVTGIVLSLDHSLHSPNRPPGDLTTDTGQVYAYFAEQVIAPLPQALQRFLEESSVLEDLSAQRCDLLRAANDSAMFLEEVTRRGLFVSSRAGWLTYHSLFRDFLRARLMRNPQRRIELLERAGDLYRDEDELERALDCYGAAGRDDQAIALLRAAVPRFRQRSRHTTLLACFERLSQPSAVEGAAMMQPYGTRHSALGTRHSRSLPPDLLLAQALVYGDLALWERAYLALQLAETSGDDEIGSEAQILRADLLHLQGDHRQAQATLAMVQPDALPVRLQFDYHLTTGRILIRGGQIDAAIPALEQARELVPATPTLADDPGTVAYMYDNLGYAYIVHGEYATARGYLKLADACWQASGNDGRRAATLNNLGMIALEERRYAEARAAFESGVGIARQSARPREEVGLLCSLADLALLEGDLQQSGGHFAAAFALAKRLELTSEAAFAAVGALWVAALNNAGAGVEQWQPIAATAPTADRPDLEGRIALARCLLALDTAGSSPKTVQEPIEAAARAADALGPLDRAYVALLQAALVWERAGWEAAAAAWAHFAEQAHELPVAPLIRMLRPHQKLIAAARDSSPLARRLYDSLDHSEPVRWHITALGAFGCVYDGKRCELSSLHQALLVRLLEAGPQGIAVERLWEAVWGGDVSMPALHQALRRLRVQTGLAAAARDGTCAIRSSWEQISYDVQEFERALQQSSDQAALEQAAALYRGDFLPGVPLSAAFWADGRRTHLQQQYLDTLERLARLTEHDTPHMAISYYQHVLQLDGCREQTAVQLMRLAARFGNRSLVNTTFEHLKGALRTIGATPAPETSAQYRQLT
jgi:ATP/maltotriose-dependent transcriptional regulator MalT/DNA-binding SARP family transcriptional activator